MKLRNKLLLPVVAILVAVVVAISLINYQIAKNAITDMVDKEMQAGLSNIESQDRLSERILRLVMGELDKKNIALTRALAELIKQNPALKETDEMTRLADMFNVTEVHVMDDKGVLWWGNVPLYYGFDFNDGDQTIPFLRILDDPNYELAQEPQPNASYGFMFQYTGVARRDDKGIVQIGIAAEIIDELTSQMDTQNTIELLAFGTNGFFFIVEDNAFVAYPDKAQIGKPFYPTITVIQGSANRQWLTLDGTEYYAGFIRSGAKTIYAAIPKADFMAPLTAMRNTTAIISVAAVVLMSAILLYVLRLAIRPMEELNGKLLTVAEGDLSVNLATNARDEIGQLSRSTAKVLSIFQTLTEDFAEMAEAVNIKGEINYEIDESKYAGDYKNAAAGVNAMLANNAEALLELINALEHFGDGDFNVKVKEYPGKKAVINKTVRNIEKEITEILTDINMIVSKASEGDLAARADHTRMLGDWQKVLQGFNGLMTAFNRPLDATGYALSEMAKGNLGVKITEEFKGDFKAIKDSFNNTQDIIYMYVNEISGLLEKMSEENFDVTIEHAYVGDFVSIQRSIELIIRAMNAMLNEVNTTSDQVARSAGQISETSRSLLTGAHDQSESLSTLNGIVSEINIKTKENVESTDKAESLVRHTMDYVGQGNKEMDNMLTSMNAINESSNSISKIIRVIEDIAFQTNLLALNAAVEAARAGEHGKGFMVVAEEVRSLAQRSQEAANETTELIENSTQRSREGAEAVSLMAKTLGKINSEITELSDYVSLIAKASTQQAEAITSVMSHIGDISQVTQANSATADEVSRTAGDFIDASQAFKELVSKFKLKKRA
ncbi:MAG: methyl-accepting chemotaxis protein [Defluviitaleaceae bacterium]|nr:methyl-accepting chemotaxis protein [Defluviitaleaceae bacterium]